MDFPSDIQGLIEIQDEELADNMGTVKDKMKNVNNRIDKAISTLTRQRREWIHQEMEQKILDLEEKTAKDADEIEKLKRGNGLLDDIINEKKKVIASLKLSIKHWLRRYDQVHIDNADLTEKCFNLRESQSRTKRELDKAYKEIATLKEEIKSLKVNSKYTECTKDAPSIVQENYVSVICTLSNVIGTMSKELLEEKIEKERCLKDLELRKLEVQNLSRKMDAFTRNVETEKVNVEKENSKTAQTEITTNVSQEKPLTKFFDTEIGRDYIEDTSDYSRSSSSSKLASEFQNVIHYKDRIIAVLRSAIVNDLENRESLMAELENKLMDVRNELDGSRRNHQSSAEVKRSPEGDW